MKALSILSCITFIISVLIIGCGEERNLPTAEDQQVLMAPKNSKDDNSYGQNRILALNTSSGEIVCVPEIAVEKSPVLIKLTENGKDFSDVDVVIKVRGTAGKIEKRDTTFFFLWLNPEVSCKSFNDKLSEELFEALSGTYSYVYSFGDRKHEAIGFIKIIAKDAPSEVISDKIAEIFEDEGSGIPQLMTDVDRYSNT